jgi:hypothetical protein
MPPAWYPKKPIAHAMTRITAITYKRLPIMVDLEMIYIGEINLHFGEKSGGTV